jgi:serine/threonine protein kinase/outer membrane protein assembly factor BamB
MNPAETTPPEDELGASGQQRLAEILDQYVRQLRTGIAPSHDALISDHPSLAVELRDCLPSIDFLDSPTKLIDEASVMESLADYEILEPIGRSGMGVVYRARQKSLGREVALKVMRMGIVDKEAMERFTREAMTTAALHHTNIVPIYAVGQVDCVPFYAMQLIEGQSLEAIAAKALSSNRDLDTHKVISWGLQAAEALAYSHSRGVIHRDVKPSNLILDEGDQVWLTDFGLARRTDDNYATITNAIVGTPRYMSPEQASGATDPIDHRTDIYSLGATLYELLAGKPVFEGDSPLKIIDAIRHDAPVSVRTWRSDLPRDVDTVVMKCLAKNPAERYRSAETLAADLRAIGEDRPISVKPPGPMQRIARQLKTHRRDLRKAGTVIAATMALLVLGSMALTSYRKANEGELLIRADNGPYSAKIIEPGTGSGALSPPFTIPMQSPLRVPAGPLRLQINRDGSFSETVPATLSAGDVQPLEFTPMRQRRWEASLVDQTIRPARMDKQFRPVRFRSNEIARLDEVSGTVRWQLKTSSIDHREERWIDKEVNDELSTERQERWWKQATERPLHWVLRTDTPPAGPLSTTQPPLFLNEPIDIDGDGHDDLVVTARDQSALAAISGADGAVLWAVRYHFPMRVNPPLQSTLPHPGFASLVRVEDVDGDGVADILAQPMQFFTHSDAYQGMALVSGQTGNVLWARIDEAKQLSTYASLDQPALLAHMDWKQVELPKAHTYNFGQQAKSIVKFDRPFATAANSDVIEVPARPIVVGHQGSRQVVTLTGKQLQWGDLKTGKALVSLDLPMAPSTGGRFLRVHDNTDRFLLLVGAPTPNNSGQGFGRQFPPIKLVTVDLQARKTIWSTEIHADWNFRQSAHAATWPLVTDLDGDGCDEVIVPNQEEPWEDISTVSLAVLDSRTGTAIVERTAAVPSSLPQIDFVTATDDFDGDGWRDLVAATLFRAIGSKTCGDLHLDAFSSADGRHLWHAETDAFGEHGELNHFVTGIQSCHIDGDSWIEVHLTKPAPYNDIQRSRTLCVDPQSGTIVREANDLTPITPAAPADSIRMFLGADDRRESNVYHRFVATTELGRSGFHVLGGSGMLAIDLGENQDDAILSLHAWGPNSNLVRIDQAGAICWSRSVTVFATPYMFRQLPIWEDRPTVFFMTPDPDRDGPPRLIDVRDGSVVWQMQKTDPLPSRAICATVVDLEGDGRFELLLAAMEYPKDGHWMSRGPGSAQLYCVDGASGRVRWHQQIFAQIKRSHIPEMQDSTSWTPGRANALSPLVFVDLNGDEVRDVVIADTENGFRVITAIDGVAGKRLWRHRLTGKSDAFVQGGIPQPIALDDRTGRPKVAIMDTATEVQPQGKGALVTLKLLNGATGKTLDQVADTISSDWVSRQKHRVWYFRNRFNLQPVATDHGDHLGSLTKDSAGNQHYTVYAVDAGKLRQLAKYELFNSQKSPDDEWLTCWIPISTSGLPKTLSAASTSATLVCITSRGATGRNVLDGRVLWSTDWDTQYGRLRSVEAVTAQNGKTLVIGRCVDADRTWVALDLTDGAAKWRFPQLGSGDGQIWGAGFQVVHRTGGLPPHLVTSASGEQFLVTSIASELPTTKDSLPKGGAEGHLASTFHPYRMSEDRRYVRNLFHLADPRVGVERTLVSLHSIIFGLGLFVLPCWYLRGLLRRQYSLRYLLLATPVVAVVFLTLRLTPSEMWSTYPSLLSRATYGLMGATLLAAIYLVGRQILQRRWKTLLVSLVVVSIAIGIVVVVPIVHTKWSEPNVRFDLSWRHLINPAMTGMHLLGALWLVQMAIRALVRSIWRLVKWRPHESVPA